MNSNLRQKLFTGVMFFWIAVFFIPSFAGAFTYGNDRPHQRLGMIRHQGALLGIWQNPKMVQELKFTDEQIKKLKEADFAHRENCLQLKSKLDALYLEMEKRFAADSVDEDKVLQLAQKISALKGEMFVKATKSRLTLIKILTADQLKNLKHFDLRPYDRQGKMRRNGKHGMLPFKTMDPNG